MRSDARSITREGDAPQVDEARYDRLMRTGFGFLMLGVLLLGAGLVWIAQGLGLEWAPQSFMTADRLWVFIGAIVALAGAVLIGWSRQRTSEDD